MQDFSAYIGKKETVEELISAVVVQKICATLNKNLLTDGDDLPPLWQWCFFVETKSEQFLGRDGHPKLGDFLPDLGVVNRMWAGGRFEFFTPLIIGKKAVKTTTIKAITEKNGRSGKLIFVTLLHQYFQQNNVNGDVNGDAENNLNLCISEEQDIVYKQPTPPKLSGDLTPLTADYSQNYNPNEILLFRYSALTFNGHRIHYDFPYATNVEGYHGLVIHGPLLATYMLDSFISHNPDKKVVKYSYRGLRALCVPSELQAAGKLDLANKTAEVWISEAGSLAHQGKLEFA